MYCLCGLLVSSDVHSRNSTAVRIMQSSQEVTYAHSLGRTFAISIPIYICVSPWTIVHLGHLYFRLTSSSLATNPPYLHPPFPSLISTVSNAVRHSGHVLLLLVANHLNRQVRWNGFLHVRHFLSGTPLSEPMKL